MSLNFPAANSGNRSGGDAPRIQAVRTEQNQRPALLHRVTNAMEHGALVVFAAENHLAKGA